MPDYRVRYFEPVDAPAADEFAADNDIQAVRQATRLAGSKASELWCGNRRIIVLNEA